MIDANERMSVDVLLTGANGRLGEAVAREFAHTAPTLRVAALGRSLLDAPCIKRSLALRHGSSSMRLPSPMLLRHRRQRGTLQP